jgi:hypothetical protein
MVTLAPKAGSPAQHCVMHRQAEATPFFERLGSVIDGSNLLVSFILTKVSLNTT